MTTTTRSPLRRTALWIALALLVPYPVFGRSSWISETALHTLFEVTATTLAAVVGAVAFVRYRASRRQLDLFVAVGFAGTAFFDCYHAIVTSLWFGELWPSPPATLIPWSWNASRMFLAAMLAYAMWAERRRSRSPVSGLDPGAVLAGAAIVFGAISVAFILVPLPRAYFPELPIGRPAELASALLFGYALFAMVRCRTCDHGPFERWLSISLLVGFIGQGVYMTQSYELFDVMFDLAHTFKLVSYLAVLAGLLISIDELYLTQAATAGELHNMALAVEHAGDPIAMFDSDWRVIYANQAYLDVHGRNPEELIGQFAWDLGSSYRDLRDELVATMAEGQTWSGIRTVDRGGGEITEVEASWKPILDGSGAATAYVTVMRDITERRQLETELEERATHDPLTGLVNRAVLLEHLEALVTDRSRTDPPSAVLFLDLDNFKLVNDSLGHLAGDELLKTVGARIQAEVREDDIVGRLGGDEFLIICRRVRDEFEAMHIANRIIASLDESFAIAGRSVHASGSVGVALTRDGDSAEDLLSAADAAAYHAKSTGRDRAELFDDELRRRAQEQLEITNQLREALRRGRELLPYYQPIVDLHSAEVVGFEALARWQHPDRGLLEAGSFIESAEESGLEVPLGWSILDQVAEQIARWDRDPDVPRPVPVNVNVSARQLRDPEFLVMVRNAIDLTGIPPELLRVEITEHTVVANLEVAADTLRGVRDLGVSVAIDDFGVGNSSLSYLRTLPFDVVKIDMSFIQAMNEGTDSAAIVAAVIRMARALGHTVVAEGVEREDQMATLHSLRCDRGQGLLFSDAVSPEIATDLLRNRIPLTHLRGVT